MAASKSSPNEPEPDLSEALARPVGADAPKSKAGDGASRSMLVAVNALGSDGVPERYMDGVDWLRKGVRRQPWAVAVGLVTGWTGVWLAFWAAVAGVFLGVVVALGLAGDGRGGVFLFNIGVGQAVTVASVFVGGVLGAIGGFLIVPKLIFIDHPLTALVSIASGAVIAAVIVVVSAAYERPILRFRGYRRLSRDEVRRVAPCVKTIADAMDLEALPRFGMSDTLVPNAWTHMRTIILTKGLLQSLDDNELTGVLAHELHHWRAGDAVGGHIVWAAAFPVALLYNLGTVLAGRPHNGEEGHAPTASAAGSRSTGRTLVALVGWFIAWPAWVITRLVLVPIVASTQRGYEYQADAAAAEIGYAAALSSALRKMGAFEGGRSGWEQAMSATHPPTELRLEALQSPRPDDFEYQEEDLRIPTPAETRRFLFGLREVVVPSGTAEAPANAHKKPGLLGAFREGLHSTDGDSSANDETSV